MIGQVSNALVGFDKLIAKFRDSPRLLDDDVFKQFDIVGQTVTERASSAFVIHVALLHGTR